MMQNHDIVMRK